MKILHYSLGLPPYRTGGLTKYSVDLMIEQHRQGHTISLLYPGSFNILSGTKILKNKGHKGINVYEIINPLPIPLLNGIKEPGKYMKNVSKGIYKSFLTAIKPDVIHIHTLMGIHKEFIEVSKDLKIKLVYTSHDYFGACPKVNLVNTDGKWCNDFDNGRGCISCNQGAFNMPLVCLMQSKLYRKLKDNTIVKKLRKGKKEHLRKEIDSKNNLPTTSIDEQLANNYIKLRNYYFEMFSMVDFFHFNSSIAMEVYENYLGKVNGEIIPITHNNICDNRKEKEYSSIKPLNISYLGPMEEYKGFFLLIKSLDGLKEKGINNWHLNIYGDNKQYDNLNPKFYSVHGRYSYNDFPKIFNNTDLLVIPSIWKETFGFIGLEALANGVPILASSFVGFKDILKKNMSGIIFNPSITELRNCLEKLINDKSVLLELNRKILEMELNFTINNHTEKIIDFYKYKE